MTWIAYLISHESHHRGQIAQALKQSGVRPPDEISYGTWGYWKPIAAEDAEGEVMRGLDTEGADAPG